MSGTHMVCMYGKILTINVYMTSGPACYWVYMCVVYEYLYTDELMKWRSGQVIVLYTVIGFLICFLCLCEYVCVFAHLYIGVCACRPGNEATSVCVCIYTMCVHVCALLCVLQSLAQLY